MWRKLKPKKCPITPLGHKDLPRFKKSGFCENFILVTTGVFRIRKGKRFPWRFSTLFPQFFLNFSTRSEAECGNFEEILWKLSGKSEWKTFPLEYPENGSWLQIYLLSSIFGVSPLLVEPPIKDWGGAMSHLLLRPRPLNNWPRPQFFLLVLGNITVVQHHFMLCLCLWAW